MKGAPGHLDALTGIRGIAAWLVVLFHVRETLTGIVPAAAIAVMDKGYLAVDLFFVLSGFVIWLNYAERVGDAGGIGAFLWKRFARVWPLHAVVLAGFVALIVMIVASGRDPAGYPVGELPLQLVLMQNWGLTTELTWNHPAWSISTETGAYLAFPLIALALTKMPARVRWLGAVGAALCGAIWAIYAAAGHDMLGEAIPQLGLLRCLGEFALGCVVARGWLTWRDRLGLPLFAATTGAVIGGLALVFGWPETATVPALFALAVMVLACGRDPLSAMCRTRPLLYLGEISYSTYLAHYGLFIVFKLLFVDASLMLGWWQLAGYLALVLFASIVLFHGVERPAQRWFLRHPPGWARRAHRRAPTQDRPATPSA